MQIKPIHIANKNRLIRHYRKERDEIMKYFDYTPFADFALRAQHIDNRMYDRETLATMLHKMNNQWGAPTSTLKQVERLRDGSSVVVIGGQQAGLLTGPLYSINKLISIVRLAQEQEAKLNRPVVPVFWIAGEDHDLEEINHIFSNKNNSIYKHRFQSELNNKKSIAHLNLNQEAADAWIKAAFADLQETAYTKDVYEKIVRCLELSKTYVDFFARLIFELFPEEGIVLIDSAHEDVRRMESDFFQLLITKQEAIAKSVFNSEQKLSHVGYDIPLDTEIDDVHLFYHDEFNERILLKREDNAWLGKNDEVSLTTEEIVAVATDNPERLSNNVVTRPLTQEFLFPTLAFVGGDGEISYWATLKEAFHEVGFQMPPVVPRMSFTYQTERVSKLLEVRALEVEAIIERGVDEVRMNWLTNQSTPPVERIFQEAHEKIAAIHVPLQQMAEHMNIGLEAEAEKNFDYMKSNLDYLQRKMEQKLSKRFDQELSQFDELQMMLRPNGGLQERTWSPLPFVNEYGVSFLRHLMNDTNLSVEEDHYLVKL